MLVVAAFIILILVQSPLKIEGEASQNRWSPTCTSPKVKDGISMVASTWISPREDWADRFGARNGRHERTSALPQLMVRGGSVAKSLCFIKPEIALTSIRGVSELMISSMLGFIASKKGVLDPSSVQALSKISYNVFLPPLMLVNVANTVVGQSSRSLIPLPFFALVSIGISLVSSRMLMKAMRIDPRTEKGRGFLAACSFQNAGILPFLFVDALFRSHPDPTILPKSVAYISFSLIGWTTTFFSLAYNILAGEKKEQNLGENPRGSAALNTLKRVINPPVIACFLGLFIGVTPILRKTLMEPGAVLSPVFNSFTTLGKAYSPASLMVLAGSLANSPRGGIDREMCYHVGGISLGRFIISPIVTAVLLKIGLALSLIPNDPVLLFVLLMQSCMPSAQNSVLILQVEGLKESAGRMAQMLLILYLISIFPASILLSIFLQKLNLV
mmetsp:Transcript_30106/g.38849  ORF Transcript_30106/g.38849 Transcript_30106/m.38849 type:complete len:444 (-) Transcript_30106:166-1497(-)